MTNNDTQLASIIVKGENILDIKKHSFVIDICKRPRDAREVFRNIEHIYNDFQAFVNAYRYMDYKKDNKETIEIFSKVLHDKRAHMKSCITKLGKMIPDAQRLDVDYLENYARKRAYKLNQESRQRNNENN